MSVVASTEDSGATTRVTVTYDADPTIGTAHYHTRIFDFAASTTADNPGLLGEWTEGVISFDTEALGFYNYSAWGHVVLSDLTTGEVINDGDTTVTARVWSPKAGESVLLKVENAANGSEAEEFWTTTTQDGGWEILTWDVSGADNTKTLDKPLLFPSAGSATQHTYLFDYLAFEDQTLDFDVDSITLAQNVTNVYDGDAWTQFVASTGVNGTANLTPFGNSGSVGLPVIDFVDSPGADSLSYVKTAGGQTWAGVSIEPHDDSEVITPGAEVITVDVYSPGVGQTVMLKVEDSNNGGIFLEKTAVTTASGEWETLTFDFTSPTNGTLDHANTYDKLNIFPKFGDVGADEQYYFKNLDLSTAMNGASFDYEHLLLNSPAVITSAATASIDEDASAGDAVITVTATDSESNTITYDIDTTAKNTFAIDSSTGAITLKTGVTLDHETTDSYTVTVTATDDGSNVATSQTLTVSVGDVNEAPTITSGATGTNVSDKAAAGTTVYTVAGSDVDSGTTLSYSLGGTDASSLSINSATGVVSLASAADYSSKSSYSFTVTATDDGTGTLSSSAQAVTFSVLPNLLDMSATLTTAGAAADDINDGYSAYVTDASETYIKLVITLDANSIDTSSTVTLDGIQGELVLDENDFEIVDSYVSSSSTTASNKGLGFVIESGSGDVNDDTTSAQFGDFTSGTSGSFVDNDPSGPPLNSKAIVTVYLNPVDSASSVDIGIENAFATEGSTQYAQSDYSITVDIV
jgi:hypothetical protein